MGERYYASDVRWQEDARCIGSGFEFVPDNENDDELQQARTWCNGCPVRMECLAYALLYHSKGFWGGTSTAERTLLSYTRSRAKCPVCKSTSLVKTGGHEICTHCGLSWNRTTEGGDDEDRGAVGAGTPGPAGPGAAAPGPGSEQVPA